MMVYFLQQGVANATVPRSLSVPGRTVIVRSVSFATHKEHDQTDPSDGMQYATYSVFVVPYSCCSFQLVIGCPLRS